MQAILGSAMQASAVVAVRYPVRPNLEAWVLPEGKVPEATAHSLAVYRIFGMLRAWARRVRPERSVSIGTKLAMQWLRDHPRTGADPDVCVIEPAPADFDDLRSLKLWEPGRVAPRLAIEVVSASLPHKDYDSIQERYAAMGVEELLVFDPLLEGPRSLGGPVPLQLWRRDATAAFERVHFGAEPVFSQVLEAWCLAEGRVFHVSADRRGTQRWLSPEDQVEHLQATRQRAQAEAERAQAEAERAQAEAERAQAEAERERQARLNLERRLAELESKLQR